MMLTVENSPWGWLANNMSDSIDRGSRAGILESLILRYEPNISEFTFSRWIGVEDLLLTLETSFARVSGCGMTSSRRVQVRLESNGTAAISRRSMVRWQ